MIRNKKFLLAVMVIIGSVMIVGVVATFTKMETKDDTSKTMDTSQDEPYYFSANVENLDDFSSRLPEDSQDVWRSLWRVINMNEGKQADYYRANIRQDSFKTHTTSGGTPVTEFLVDISDVERTFKVSIEGDNNTDYRTVYITCPLVSELVYGAKPCKGDETQ